MHLAEITQTLRTRTADHKGFGHSVLLDFGAEGRIRIDGRASDVPPLIDHEATPADCTLYISLADFLALAKKQISPQAAFMTGRVKIEGDVMVAMQLGALLT